ncbi:DMT family transporter [Lacticaseibacillus daqingensis]|uniref:DMT family transporter n=1 Tax=Lacticaseibacillus daqingensis TaxID=2486014 RepID=UPI000F7A4F9E|nr:DMT family transporter [Lacticaseibacillus daqingensis]
MTDQQKGLFCAILGPMFWGVSGNVAQWLFKQPGIQPDWLVTVRLLGAGSLLMAYNLVRQRPSLARVHRTPHALWDLFVFGVLGVVVSQFTYFEAVHTSNAPTATVLQYLGPVFIIVYLALRHREWPRRVDVVSILVAFVGIFFLVTRGHLDSLALSPAGLMWGIGAGLGAAIYTLMPAKLLTQFNALIVSGWGMLLGGLTLLPVLIVQRGPHLTLPIVLGIGYVTVFGTLFAYLLYLQSMKYLRPTTVAMLNVFEPLSATLIAILFFHASFGLAEVFGGLLVLSTTFLQTMPARKLRLPRR